MKKIIAISLMLASITSFADSEVEAGKSYFSCVSGGISILYHVKNQSWIQIYDFGGASSTCEEIASKLNQQILSNGSLPSFYDCKGINPNGRGTLVSDFGKIYGQSNYTCAEVALGLNRSLRQ